MTNTRVLGLSLAGILLTSIVTGGLTPQSPPAARAQAHASAKNASVTRNTAKPTIVLVHVERFFAKRMGAKTSEIRASHVLFISHPLDVARLIEQAALSAAQ